MFHFIQTFNGAHPFSKCAKFSEKLSFLILPPDTHTHLCWCLFLMKLQACKQIFLKNYHFLSHAAHTHLCWCLFLIKLQALRPATLLKRDSNTDACAYQGVRNVSFSENLAYLLNRWSHSFRSLWILKTQLNPNWHQYHKRQPWLTTSWTHVA